MNSVFFYFFVDLVFLPHFSLCDTSLKWMHDQAIWPSRAAETCSLCKHIKPFKRTICCDHSCLYLKNLVKSVWTHIFTKKTENVEFVCVRLTFYCSFFESTFGVHRWPFTSTDKNGPIQSENDIKVSQTGSAVSVNISLSVLTNLKLGFDLTILVNRFFIYI